MTTDTAKRKSTWTPLVFSFAVGAGLASIAWYTMPGPNRSETPPPTGQASPPPATAAQTGAPAFAKSQGPSRVSQSAGTQPVRDNPYWQETQTPLLIDAYRKLVADGSRQALATAEWISSRCAYLGDVSFPATLKRIDELKVAPDKKEKARQVAQHERARCQGFGEADALTGQKAMDLWKSSIAGSIPQKPGPVPAELIERVRTAAERRDPLAATDAAVFFSMRGDAFPGTMFDLGNGLYVPKRVISDAFMMVACEYGNTCGSDPGVLNRCLTSGECADSVEDMYGTYRYAPAQMELLAATRTRLEEFARTRTWPANFWTPEKAIDPRAWPVECKAMAADSSGN